MLKEKQQPANGIPHKLAYGIYAAPTALTGIKSVGRGARTPPQVRAATRQRAATHVGGGVPDAPEKKRQQEKATVGLMIELYCRGHHGTPKGRLCPDCAVLRDYADARVDHCPHIATKTFCSVCQTHCYKPEMRERIRQVMRWSGPRMLFHHPVLAVRHLAETRKQKKGQ